MIQRFIAKKFTKQSAAIIEIANAILGEYLSQGYDLSLRQLYYQFVARDILPNSERSYKMLGSVISDARMAGLIDWDAIKDRGRTTVRNSHWNEPADILESAAQSFQIDKWEDQENYVEVMVEKQALEGILIPLCREMDVAFTANKGYSSSSAMYEAAQRINQRIDEGKSCHVLYLGDHDPSGIDMSRDVEERLNLFTGYGDIAVHRLALNFEQVKKLKPPENPAKLTDSRASSYVMKYGHSSWELDAIEPKLLVKIVKTAIKNLRDEDEWRAAEMRELEMVRSIEEMARAARGAA